MAEIELIKGADNGSASDSLSKAYPKINRNFQRANTELEIHGQNITNQEGRILSAEGALSNHGSRLTTVETEQVNQGNRITSIIAHNGDGTKDTELIDARGGKKLLSERLNATDEQLAETAMKINALYTFQDAWTAWQKNDFFPIGFFGDSTIDGTGTTGWTPNTVGFLNRSPNAFPYVLEQLIKEETGTAYNIGYNFGFAGQNSTWAKDNIDSVLAPFAGIKMLGLGFGINDRLLYDNPHDFYVAFYNNIEQMIVYCYTHGIQPFLLTTQPTMEPSTSMLQYPNRNNEIINSVANRVKQDLARAYKLELVDVNKYASGFLSSYKDGNVVTDVIPDKLHFGDRGHKYIADLLFAHFCPRVLFVDSESEVVEIVNRINKCDISESFVIGSEVPSRPDNTPNTKVFHDFGDDDQRVLSNFYMFSNDYYHLDLAYDEASKNDTVTVRSPLLVTFNGGPNIEIAHCAAKAGDSEFTKPGLSLESYIGKSKLGLNRIIVYTNSSLCSFSGIVFNRDRRRVYTDTLYDIPANSFNLLQGKKLNTYKESLYKIKIESNLREEDVIKVDLFSKSTEGISIVLSNQSAGLEKIDIGVSQQLVGNVSLEQQVRNLDIYVKLSANRIDVYLTPLLTTAVLSYVFKDGTNRGCGRMLSSVVLLTAAGYVQSGSYLKVTGEVLYSR
ncbi:SGNH/GDSL hydrolase family protein [Paenibacillus sp. RS8]|uniref:SGNH/GDSL hydrolase family protein n=1 Tax=Paenibacillus sp. RS8 TaxID=3242681 RepID=UPI0035C25332